MAGMIPGAHRDAEITSADSTDAASYRCVVTNAYGSVTSSVAVLTIGGGVQQFAGSA